MTQRTLRKILVAAGLCLAVALPVQADVSAVQCCMLRDGKFIPGLRIDFGDSKTEVVVGEHGLTLANLYEVHRIQAYLQQAFQTGDQVIGVTFCGAAPGDTSGGEFMAPVQEIDGPDRPEGGEETELVD